MDPFNNSQQNTKEEDMNPNKHIMVVCVFLSSCPAWGRRVCVASLQQYYIRWRPDGPLFNTRANTTLTSQQNIIRRSHREEEEEQDISTTQHLQHVRSMCLEAQLRHVPAALTIAFRLDLRMVDYGTSRSIRVLDANAMDGLFGDTVQE